ncbi:Alpha/Beta hydrolase protein [Crassisporium funariophilum]|nr:Alpha/Beta hydrolase protein [Crassisporium funariophilum]
MATSRPRTKEIIDPAYPLLEANRTIIESVKRETFEYGQSDVHKLDVYYPTGSCPDSRYPILVFFYGGSLVRGARTSAPSNLVHNNLGAFFASRGVLTVIPDYRLVPSITFPQGSEDVRDAINWVTRNLSEGDHNEVYLLGHSAGGVHVAGLLFTPELFQSLEHSMRGVALMGVPIKIPPERQELYAAALQYYGDPKAILRCQPSSLLQRASKEYIALLPAIRNLIAGSEPRFISTAMRAFMEEFRNKGGSIEEYVLAGHDHLSPILALSTGSGEEWAEGVVKWIWDGVHKHRFFGKQEAR